MVSPHLAIVFTVDDILKKRLSLEERRLTETRSSLFQGAALYGSLLPSSFSVMSFLVMQDFIAMFPFHIARILMGALDPNGGFTLQGPVAEVVGRETSGRLRSSGTMFL